jgi:hypothetical protein
LSGLIDGDGHITMLTTCNIQICFPILDLPLAIFIKTSIGSGSIYKVKGKNAYNLIIFGTNCTTNTRIGKVLNLIDGKIRNQNKLTQVFFFYFRLVDTNKGKINFSTFKDFKLNTSNNLDNYRVAGFADADTDASFQIAEQ